MKIERILAPIDFSDASLVALKGAATLAKEKGAALTLLHVHPIVRAVFLDATMTEPPEEIVEHLNEAESRLQELAQRYASGVDCETQSTFGSPVKVIVEESSGYDLCVMSSHGESGLTELLLGSVTERVVRGAKCSIWVVKPDRV